MVIPAHRPSGALIELVRTLAGKDLGPIVIVDDGSGAEYADVFDQASRFERVTVLRHAVNLGKGAALKTAFNHVLCAWPHVTGVVTADADGQHHPDDIERVAGALALRPAALVLGCRTFGPDVPLRSRIGNIATRGIMRAMVGQRLSDTQTGLRGIPSSLLPRLLRLESTGYEFELEMLLTARQLSVPVAEQPIRTIYEPGNKSSHFNPVSDSMKIYFVLLRFGSVSLITALIDNLVFILAQTRGWDVLPSQALGRILAVAFNYSMVRRSVFYSRQAHRTVLPKYLALVLASGTVSYAGIQLLRTRLGISAVAAKLFVETVLFFANFAVQRLLIFRQRKRESKVSRWYAPRVFAAIAAAVFLALVGAEFYGLRTAPLFTQEIWYPYGLHRFAYFSGAFLALAAPLLLLIPWVCAPFFAVLLALLTTVALGPRPVLAVAFFLVSACALGARVSKARDHSFEDHLLATLLGAGVYIFLMTFLARLPVNTAWLWGGVLAVPIVFDVNGVRARLIHWANLVRSVELRGGWERAAFALVLFLLMAHWMVALKPEVTSDGLAMHLAVPMNIAANHRMTFEPARFLWSVMPMGADWCYSIVYLLGGEGATHLLVWMLLGMLSALLYGMLARVANAAVSLLLVAGFLATPLVQLMTGALFVENLQASMILGLIAAIWRFRETGEAKYLYLAMALGGTGVAIKVGTLAFVAPALVFAGAEAVRRFRSLGPRPWASAAAALGLLLATAAPPYAIAYAKTGNPVFPFRNETIRSPLLDPDAGIRDERFKQPLRWNTIYDLTFHTNDYYEGQNGSLGFAYLVVVPMALLGLVVAPGAAAATGVVGIAASILVLQSEPNARYIYAALPLFLVPFAGLLDWMRSRERRLFRAVVVFMVASTALGLWFLPSASYYNKDFSLRKPFSRAERALYLREAAPVRDVIAYYNRSHAGSAVLLTQDSAIAGLSGDVYENHWHQFATLDRIRHTTTLPGMLELMKSWRVGWLIVNTERIRPSALASLVQLCTSPEYWVNGTYLARLDPGCDPGAAPVRHRRPTMVAGAGIYDDTDPFVVFNGDWDQRDFQDAARGTETYTDFPGAEIAFAFDGRALNWIFAKAYNRGIAEVTIDGAPQGAVDLYSPAIEWQSRQRFCCFAPGRHEIVIRATGTRRPESKGRFIDLDAFEVE